MRIPEKELERLKQSESLVKSNFPGFGINKKQEIIRLLYEISKREKILPGNVLNGGILAGNRRLLSPQAALRPQAGSDGMVVDETILSSPKSFTGDPDIPVVDSRFRGNDKTICPCFPEECASDFESLKKYLLERRFPFTYGIESSVCAYLPKIELEPSDALTLTKNNFSPAIIFIEKDCRDSFLARRLAQVFPRAKFKFITSLKEHLSCKRGFQIEDYNNRRKALFLIKQKYDFYKSCPCTKFSIPCAYQVFNLGFGCIYECTYCFLQEYTNCPGIVLPANLDSFFDAFPSYKRKRIRIGTGEFSDSLALDEVTSYSVPLIEFFRKRPEVTFEFKTKSSCVSNLLQAKHAGNIVVSWSLNPQKIIRDNEHLTASLSERLKSATRCVQAGYKIGIHFDPVFYFRDWKREYALLIELVFEKIKPGDIAWISIGTFRFSPSLKKIIENRFPGNKILDEELLKGYDGKLRYPYILRLEIYQAISGMLLKHSRKLAVYLCMEEARMWKDVGIRMPVW